MSSSRAKTLGKKILVAVDSTITSKMPEFAASVRLCVASTTRQLALRRTFNHSRILSRITGCPSINQASSTMMALG